jgi:hypothetical protein
VSPLLHKRYEDALMFDPRKGLLLELDRLQAFLQYPKTPADLRYQLQPQRKLMV